MTPVIHGCDVGSVEGSRDRIEGKQPACIAAEELARPAWQSTAYHLTCVAVAGF